MQKAAEASSSSSGSSSASSVASKLPPALQALVSALYDEAAATLSGAVAAKITARGVETPLGVLTLAQVAKGERILDQIQHALERDAPRSALEQLSAQFFTVVPHQVGRTVASAVITTPAQLEEKQELVQLMRDLVSVTSSVASSSSGGSDAVALVDLRYAALRCDIAPVALDSDEGRRIATHVESSQRTTSTLRVVSVYRVKRANEVDDFTPLVGNQKLLFHGSRASNMVGILSRGLLEPKRIIARGGARTNFGWLGAGIYFGDASCTAVKYAHPAQSGNRFMLVANVALGKVAQFTKITADLDDAPPGYNSAHGVRNAPARPSDFEDDEFVVYRRDQQRLDYLVEFAVAEARSVQVAPVAAAAPAPAPAPAPVKEATKSKVRAPIAAPAAFDADRAAATPAAMAAPAAFAAAPSAPVRAVQAAPRVAPSSASAGLSPADAKIKEDEDALRHLFATQRQHARLQDPHVHLLDVYQDGGRAASWVIEDGSPLPLILTQHWSSAAAALNTPAVVDRGTFDRKWAALTSNMFGGFDWSNVLVAGGAVLACLLPGSDERDLFADTDIDLFLYGLDAAQATAKLRAIYNGVCRAVGGETQVVRTGNAVTIIAGFPHRHVQLVLRLYKSPAEVLLGFDIDACAVGFDGRRVWAVPRSRRAIVQRRNIVDMSRRSLTYEVRLYKYSKRGFAVAVPGFERARVDFAAVAAAARRPTEAKGLIRLLALEWAQLDKSAGLHNQKEAAAIVARRLAGAPISDADDRVLEFAADAARAHGVDESDYCDIFLPWGPQWMTARIVKMLERRDRASMFSQRNPATGKLHHRHTFVSGIENVISGKSLWCRLCQQAGAPKNSAASFAHGPIAWLAENPGRQLLTGSFHPVDDDRWHDGVYVTDGVLVRVVAALRTGAPLGSLAALSGAAVPRRALSPLHWAATLGSPAVEQLAKLALNVAPDDDGALVPPLVLAAINGHVAAVRALLSGGVAPGVLRDIAPLIAHGEVLRLLHVPASTRFAEPPDHAQLDPLARSEQPVLACAFDRNKAALASLGDVTARDRYGVTALHVLAARSTRTPAAATQVSECADSLIARGANVDAVDVNGATPLFYAAQCGNAAAAKVLVQNGAKVSRANALGHTPLDACYFALAALVTIDTNPLPAPYTRLPRPETVERLHAIRDLLLQHRATATATLYDVPTLPPSPFLEANLRAGTTTGRPPKQPAKPKAVKPAATKSAWAAHKPATSDSDDDGSENEYGEDDVQESDSAGDSAGDSESNSDDEGAGWGGGARRGRGGAAVRGGRGGRGASFSGRGASAPYAGRGGSVGGRGGAAPYAGRGGFGFSSRGGGAPYAGRGGFDNSGGRGGRGGRGGFVGRGGFGGGFGAPATGAGFGFGSPARTAAPAAFGTFGTPLPAQPSQGGFSFGAAPPAQSGFSFGAAPTQGFSFGAALAQPLAAPTAFGPFGTPIAAPPPAPAAPPQPVPTSAWGMFGTPAPAPVSAPLASVVVSGTTVGQFDPRVTTLADVRREYARMGRSVPITARLRFQGLEHDDVTLLSVLAPFLDVYYLDYVITDAAPAFRAPQALETPPRPGFGWQPQITPVRSFGQGPAPQPHTQVAGPQPGWSMPAQPAWSQPTQAAPSKPRGAEAAPDLSGTRAPAAKLLLLVSHLFKSGALSHQERAALKQLVMAGDAVLLAVLECFEIDGDEDELLDSMKLLCQTQ